MTDMKLTAEERAAIRALQRLAQRWPRSLWIFVGSGFSVVRTTSDGERAVRQDGSYDPAYKVTEIYIPGDGGDW